jgi:hypothetical protein
MIEAAARIGTNPRRQCSNAKETPMNQTGRLGDCLSFGLRNFFGVWKFGVWRFFIAPAPPLESEPIEEFP